MGVKMDVAEIMLDLARGRTTEEVIEAAKAERFFDPWIKGPGDTAFVSGSRIEGLANELSDVDFFVVGDLSHGPPQVSIIAGVHIDCELFSAADITALSRRMAAADSGGDSDCWQVPLGDFDTYYRTTIGRPVVNADAFAELTRSFDRELLARVFARSASLRGAFALDEAHRLLDLGDELDAYVAARAGFEWALDAMLARNGEPFPSRKWRFEKLARAFGRSSDAFASAWTLKALGSRTPREYLELVERQAVEWGLEIGGGEAVATWIASATSSASLFRLPGQSVVVHRRTGCYRLSPEGAFAWEALTAGLPFADVTARFSAEFGRLGIDATRELRRLVDRSWRAELLDHPFLTTK